MSGGMKCESKIDLLLNSQILILFHQPCAFFHQQLLANLKSFMISSSPNTILPLLVLHLSTTMTTINQQVYTNHQCVYSVPASRLKSSSSYDMSNRTWSLFKRSSFPARCFFALNRFLSVFLIWAIKIFVLGDDSCGDANASDDEVDLSKAT